mmetsp:Transcript_10027/g.26633  ORF Transcript_10027/g.26633 Transcript_10027/m.26633 type:complete len:352 (+) Transcript_10027:27-1082(+)
MRAQMTLRRIAPRLLPRRRASVLAWFLPVVPVAVAALLVRRGAQRSPLVAWSSLQVSAAGHRRSAAASSRTSRQAETPKATQNEAGASAQVQVGNMEDASEAGLGGSEAVAAATELQRVPFSVAEVLRDATDRVAAATAGAVEQAVEGARQRAVDAMIDTRDAIVAAPGRGVLAAQQAVSAQSSKITDAIAGRIRDIGDAIVSTPGNAVKAVVNTAQEAPGALQRYASESVNSVGTSVQSGIQGKVQEAAEDMQRLAREVQATPARIGSYAREAAWRRVDEAQQDTQRLFREIQGTPAAIGRSVQQRVYGTQLMVDEAVTAVRKSVDDSQQSVRQGVEERLTAVQNAFLRR